MFLQPRCLEAASGRLLEGGTDKPGRLTPVDLFSAVGTRVQ